VNGRRGFLAALVGLAVCPQAPAAARSPVRHFGWTVMSWHNNRLNFYRPARRPIEVNE
jgi:hypothetical protein